MNKAFISVEELMNITGVSDRKAREIIRRAAKIGKEKTGVYVKGKALRKVVEKMLMCDTETEVERWTGGITG